MRIRGTISPDAHESETELVRIHGFFQDRFLEDRFHGNDGRSKWRSHVVDDLGLEMIVSQNYEPSPLDTLLEMIYSGSIDKVLVKDPDAATGGFILMSRDFAKKVLVLGGLP